MTNRERAQQIYDEATPARERTIQFGMTLRGILTKSVDEIESHLNMVDEINEEHGTRLSASKFEVGTARETIEAAATKSRRRANGRKGYRALQEKYGEDAAKSIVRNAKAGRL